MAPGWCSDRCCASSTTTRPPSGWRPTDACTVTVDRRRRSWSAAHLRGARPPLRAGRGRRAWSPAPSRRTTVTLTAARRRRAPRLAARARAELDLPPSVISTLRARQAAAARLRLVPHQRQRTTGRATTPTASTRCAPTRWRWPGSPPGEELRGPTWWSSSATRCTPTRPPRRCGSSSPRGATSSSRRAPSCKDYEEYAHLYPLAWSDPANRWLLSTLPSTMIFDDHDVRDDWNTSLRLAAARWRQTEWWHGRIVAGLASYWVYQHLGNLSAAERADDEIWQQVAAHDGPDELDLSEVLDALRRAGRPGAADLPLELRPRAQRQPAGRGRLPRRARAGGRRPRSCSTTREMAWLDEQLTGDVDHLFVGTSLPFLLPPGPAAPRGVQRGAGRRRLGPAGRAGRREGSARRVDLEHWGAFQESFRTVAEMAVAGGHGGAGPGAAHGDVPVRRRAPQLRLGGDPARTRATTAGCSSRVLQVVCSPIRNPLPRSMRFATAVLSYGVAGRARPAGLALRPRRRSRRSAGSACAGRGSTTTSPPPR